nr:PQ-loop repeat-containing protein 3-like [Onthophagus taurus]
MPLLTFQQILETTADFLSVITIAICFILKIPQIITVLKLKHARGINLIGLLMELTSYTIMLSYNFRNGYALLTYMEYPIILIQNLSLILLVMYFKGYLNIYAVIGAGIYFTFAAAFILGIVPMSVLSYLVPMCTPIGASSKVVQLLEMVRLKNADSVSLLTWFISAFTNASKFLTS